MIEFAFGFITGILLSILVVVVLMFFRKVIEQKINIIEKQIDLKSPRPKGMIVMPESHAEEVRADIINKNRKRGLDTPISELL